MSNIEKVVDKNVEKLSAQLKEWGAKIDELADRTGKAGAEVKADVRERVVLLKAKRLEAQAKLDELRKAGSDKWETFRVGIEVAWKDLEAAFKELKN
jgi:hypothetical protein